MLLKEILKWTEEKLPLWQRDATRRLFQQESELSNEDYSELYQLLKADNGFPIPPNLSPEPLNVNHLPAPLVGGDSMIIKSIRDLKNVNRIAPNQKLKFASSGMTVVYGGNGTGKSGYVRVLKQACRARGQVETIHPDATGTTALNALPEAFFDIEINGTHKPLHWSLSESSPEELATITIFDTYCARAYLTAEQDVAYLPYGLDVVENLANKIIPELTKRLNAEIDAINVDPQVFKHLHGNTKVGQLISSLNFKTNRDDVIALGSLTSQDINRISELDKALAEADPAAKAKELHLSVARIKELAEKIKSKEAWVSDAAINRLKGLDVATIEAYAAEKNAAKILQGGEVLLPGTGEPIWKALFEAARKYSTELAYPEHTFPHTDDNAVCLLCQQSLNGAGDRLKRFEKHIQDDIAKAAALERKRVDEAKMKIKGTNLSFDLNESLISELTDLDKTVVSTANKFQASIEQRRTWMLKALESHEWEGAPNLNENPRPLLRTLAACQLRTARVFAKAVNEAKKKALTQELGELRARQNLFKSLNEVLQLLERKQQRNLLEICKKQLKTRPISDKSKELASQAVTNKLKLALEDEFKELGISHIKTVLKDRNDRGKIRHQLLLNLPSNYKLEQILSEGEQRAIALGSFLAELKLSNHSGAIVFDDPVSSLDHKRRSKVAKRLANESQHRQVIVFTHDIVFLSQLRDSCEKQNLCQAFCFLEPNSGYYGNVSEGLPWDHKSFKDRIDSLEKAQKRFEKIPWPADPSEALSREMIQQYSFLRATIERVTQDFILCGTVQRFKDYIQVKNLEHVVGLQKAEVEEVNRIYQRCHDLVEAHDNSALPDFVG